MFLNVFVDWTSNVITVEVTVPKKMLNEIRLDSLIDIPSQKLPVGSQNFKMRIRFFWVVIVNGFDLCVNNESSS